MKVEKLLQLLKCIRVHQWIKNGFLFMPVFFAGQLFAGNNLVTCVVGFFAFCFVASFIYIINDIKDVEQDRLHPTKSLRPIAGGTISISFAITIGVLLFASGLTIAAFLSLQFLGLILSYLLLNILYVYFLKKISIVDVTVISIGFVLRILAGATLCHIEISQWLYIMTFLLAFFLAIAKRRDDLVLSEGSDLKLRKANDNYSLEFVNVLMGILSAVIIVAYLLYVTSFEIAQRFPHKKIYISAIFVFLGIVRYLQITIVEKKSGSPTKVILKDIFIQINVLAWLIFFLFQIYFADGNK